MSAYVRTFFAALASLFIAVAAGACNTNGSGPQTPLNQDTPLTAETPATADTPAAPEQAALACPSVNGKLHVSGTQLVDKNEQPVQLRGVSTHGLAWFPGYVNSSFFGELRQNWHANIVRLAMYTAESGGYCSDGNKAQLRALIDDGVKFATENDLHVTNVNYNGAIASGGSIADVGFILTGPAGLTLA